MAQHFNLQPTFIEGSKGSLFAMHHRPVTQSNTGECVIVLPAFAEEMNRCRYMQTLLAQSLTANGIGLLAVDLYGTGDSSGEFIEADWSGWIDDTIIAANYAISLGYTKVSLLGIRLGALLALAALPDVPCLHQLLFWQPVTNGKATLTQFLRLKIAAAMARGEEGITTAKLEEEINNGNSIQIAGYDVSPGLFNGIYQAHIDNHISADPVVVHWFSVLPHADKKTPRIELKTIEQWQQHNNLISHHSVIGPAFWQAHERTLAPNLIPATIEIISAAITEESINE